MLRGNTNTSGDDSQANREHGSAGEDSFEVTPLSVVVFVLLVCGTLLLLYYGFLLVSNNSIVVMYTVIPMQGWVGYLSPPLSFVKKAKGNLCKLMVS